MRLFLVLLYVIPFLVVVHGHDNDDDFESSPPLPSQEVASLVPLLLSSSSYSSTKEELGENAAGLVWYNLSVNTHRHHTGIPILHPSSFVVRNGQVTGLLGPSGSGKSTLLSVFAGLCRLSVDGFVGGFSMARDNDHHVTIRWHEIPAKHVAFLQQHDDFFTQLTVQETLDLAAFLELPHLDITERRERIRQTINYLGLAHCSHRQIGSVSSSSSTTTTIIRPSSILFGKRKNDRAALFESSPANDPYHSSYGRPGGGGRLSGGERRRLSVALELLTSKELLLADEPTSGLDAAYSVVVMKLLRDLARSRNIPAIVSLHQPRSSIWMSLDAIILMAPGGKVCYAGPRAMAVSYFQSLGHKLPPNTNPAEFLVDLVSIDSEDAEQAAQDLQRIDELASQFEAYQKDNWKKQSSETTGRMAKIQFLDNSMVERGNRDIKSRSIWRWISRLGALLRRSWRQNVRDVNLNVFRLLANIGNAMLLAGIFPTVQGPVPTTSSIADRVALLSFGAVNLCMLAYMKTIHLFAQERPVIEREQIRDQYSAAEYLLAKMLAEIPLDAGFSAVFTTVLKKCTGLKISWKRLTSIFALLTTTGASMGFLIGSLVPSEQYATTAGIPVLVVLLIVGVINPSGVDPTKPKPFLVRLVKEFSPFAYAIEALCVEEFPGVHFQFPKRRLWERLRAIPRMGGLALVTVIEALGLSDVSYAGAMKHLAILAAGYTVASWFGLIMQQQHRRRVKASVKKPSTSRPDRDKSNGRNLAKVPTRFRL